MIENLYWYRARVDRVVDGDTIDLITDLGHRMNTGQRYRLLGIDTPEKKTTTYEAGVAAQAFLEALVRPAADAGLLLAKTYKSDSFGRWLVDLHAPVRYQVEGDPKSVVFDAAGTWVCLNKLMIDAGHAILYR